MAEKEPINTVVLKKGILNVILLFYKRSAVLSGKT